MLDSLTLSQSHKDSLERATAKYETNIDQAGSYLHARGITRDAALSYRLGVVSEPEPGHERFVGMLALPYLTVSGPVAIKFRRIDGSDGAKYDSPAGQRIRLYNSRSLASPGDLVAVCEGELDALVCTSALGIPAVGVPGASTWEDHWARCFADYPTVLVVADHDVKTDDKGRESSPGLKHAHKVVQKIHGARLVTPPPGLDLGEWVLRDGPEAVRKVMGA